MRALHGQYIMVVVKALHEYTLNNRIETS